MENTIKTLTQMGLTEYESKSYISLASLITAKADTISKESGVPRSKIYTTLDSLEQKGFITIEKGRPLKYTIKPPNEVFEIYKRKVTKQIDDTEKTITQIYESKLPNFNAPIWSIEGEDTIINKEYELIKRAQTTLNIRIGFLLPSQVEKIIKKIKKAIKNNVEVKILTVPYCIINGEKIDIKELFSDITADIKYAPIPAAQLIIRDDKEMILVFADENSENIPENLVGLWNHYPTIITHYNNAFNKHWKRQQK